MEPRLGRGELDGVVVNVGRGVADCVEVQQDETLALVCPLARDSRLYTHEHRFLQISYTTHRQIPLIYVVESINTDIEIFRKAEDFDPK